MLYIPIYMLQDEFWGKFFAKTREAGLQIYIGYIPKDSGLMPVFLAFIVCM